jgi:Tfp pilus assembly protein PilV
MQTSSNKGFSLVETIVAIGVLTTGILGAAGVLAAGMQNLSSSPSDVVVTQKAAQAIETVFAARDSHRFTWAPGNDGLLNTADDGPIETVALPGRTITLIGFQREIAIQDVVGENGQLRSITVTITYQNGRTTRTYRLTSYISTYA